MIKKIFLFTFVFFSVSSSVSALEDIQSEELLIVPRISWGANSLYNDINSDYWKTILQSRANYTPPYQSPESIIESQKKTESINSYLYDNFGKQFSYQEKIDYNTGAGIEYAWDLGYSSYVDSIIIHHTHSEYDDDITGLNQIHKYHSINRQWGDIGYNYIIGYDGVIYEGREGGDYVVGAHSTYNNIGTVGIAVLGNYDAHGITDSQYSSLEKLIQHLTKKYGIDLSKKRYYHMNCSGIKCDTFPIETYLDSVLIGHRDATHTSCPGDELYEQIQKIREDNITYTSDFSTITRGTQKSAKSNTTIPKIHILLQVLSKYSQKELENIFILLDKKLEQEIDSELRKKLQILRLAVKLSFDK